MEASTMSAADKLALNDAGGLRNGSVEAAAGTDLDEVAAALEQHDEITAAQAERAERLAAEQDALDSEDRQTPDRPEGAADELEGEDPVSDPPAREEPSGDGIITEHFLSDEERAAIPPSGDDEERPLAERLRQASGLAGDEAEARGEQPEGELPGMPQRKLTLNAGGRKPDTSEFKIAGRSLDLGAGTQFDKGEVVRMIVDVKFPEVDHIDKEDGETGQVTETIRRHKGKIVHYEIVAVG